MKKSILVLIALSLFLPVAAEARGKKVFNLTDGRGITFPELVVSVPAKLPNGVPPQKKVLLRVVVEKDGLVLSYGPVKRGLDPALIEAAEKAVQEWRFKPAMKTWARGNITPVRVRMLIEVPVVS
jgi:hypothetical protein